MFPGRLKEETEFKRLMGNLSEASGVLKYCVARGGKKEEGEGKVPARLPLNINKLDGFSIWTSAARSLFPFILPHMLIGSSETFQMEHNVRRLSRRLST